MKWFPEIIYCFRFWLLMFFQIWRTFLYFVEIRKIYFKDSITLKCWIAIGLQNWIVLQQNPFSHSWLKYLLNSTVQKAKDKVSIFTDNHGLFHLPCIRYIQKFEQLHPDILCLVFLRFPEKKSNPRLNNSKLVFLILRKLSKKDSNKAGLGKANMQQLFKLTTDKKKLR